MPPISPYILLYSIRAATCPKCDHRRAFYMQIQIRSAGEFVGSIWIHASPFLSLIFQTNPVPHSTYVYISGDYRGLGEQLMLISSHSAVRGQNVRTNGRRISLLPYTYVCLYFFVGSDRADLYEVAKLVVVEPYRFQLGPTTMFVFFQC